MSAPVIIIGSGLAGYNVAREFRKLDAQTPLVVISRDHARFYSKPMLSNALAGKKTAATLVMKTSDKMAAELNAQVLTHTEVTGVDTTAKAVSLNDGSTLAYSSLVLALGADPIRLPLEGDAADTVLSVNDLDDFARFAQTLEAPPSGKAVQRVAILGAGLIGCEFANDLLARGVQPTVLDLADRALARLLPAEGSTYLQDKLQALGVSFHFGVAAKAVNRAEDGSLNILLSDGSTLNTDLVLSAIGLKARTGLAAAAGLAVNRGVVVDQTLQTSAAHVYAVGDMAEVMGLNLPFVMPIMQQARALAATLAGNATAVTYPAMPVTVKTPGCPTVVCPPPMGANGQWVVEPVEDGLVSKFVNDTGALLGFALQGKATAQRQALATQVPATLPAQSA